MLVCLCWCTAARAGFTEFLTGMHDASNSLKDGDTCSSAYLAALAECKLEAIELQRKLVYHEPHRQKELEIISRGFYIAFVVLTVAVVLIGLGWFNARQQLKAAYLKWVKLEAQLRAHDIGVQRQAFDFAEKLAKLQTATPHAAQDNSKLSQRAGAQPLQLQSPVAADANKVRAGNGAVVRTWTRPCQYCHTQPSTCSGKDVLNPTATPACCYVCRLMLPTQAPKPTVLHPHRPRL